MMEKQHPHFANVKPIFSLAEEKLNILVHELEIKGFQFFVHYLVVGFVDFFW